MSNQLVSEESRVIVLELGENLFEEDFAVEGSLAVDIEAFAILGDCVHFLIIQIDDLPVPPYKGGLLLLQIFRIDGNCLLLLFQVS